MSDVEQHEPDDDSPTAKVSALTAREIERLQRDLERRRVALVELEARADKLRVEIAALEALLAEWETYAPRPPAEEEPTPVPEDQSGGGA